MGSLYWFSLILTITTFLHGEISYIEASTTGVNYGQLGDNLPSPSDVVALYKQYGITAMRIFEPTPEVLQALNGSDIALSLGIRNEDVQSIGSSQDAANAWFAANVEPYLNNVAFKFITVGNEIIPGEFASFIAPALQNLQTILDARKLMGLSLSTVVATSVLGMSFPPSASVFSRDAIGPMTAILQFLSNQSNPLFVNVYPYLAYASDQINIRQDYALFTAPGTVVQDGSLGYQNLFDAIVDAIYWAMENVGVGDVSVVIGETGWPNAGNGDLTTPDLAATYNRNFIQHFGKGTPKRPNEPISEGYIFAMFNEDLKPAGIEQNWGIFYPNKQPVYPVF